MKLALVTETYFPQVNGVSRALGQLVQYLRSNGDRVSLFHPRYPGDGADEESPGVHQHAFRSVPLPFYPDVRLPLVTPLRLRRLIAADQPDLVHVATEGSLGWSALRAALKLNLPTVTSYHTNFAQYAGSYGAGVAMPLVWRYLRWFHNAGRSTFCPTPSIAWNLRKKGFKNVVIWGRGVDCDRFNPDKRDESLRRRLGFEPQETVLVYMGRIAREKNLDVLADAFRSLHAERPDIRLLVVGDGPYLKHLQRALPQGAVFVGCKLGDELVAHVASADLMVFPSLSETFGNVVLEGMAAGLPVVGFDAPGPRDIIQDGITGRVVYDMSAADLARIVREVLDVPGLLREMGHRALIYARGQSWDQVNSVVRNTYGEVLEKVRSG